MANITYQTINSLTEVGFIAGSDYVFVFTVKNENGSAVDIGAATCTWRMTPYGQSDITILQKNGVITGTNTFTVTLTPEDTIDLDGTYMHQPIVQDFGGSLFRPAQGTITIVPAIKVNTTVTPWYLSGGVTPSNVQFAYQPKGAASYAASKLNIDNPGTNDAINGTSYPTWNSSNGWIFNGIDQYLMTPELAFDENTSILIRFSNAISPTSDAVCAPFGMQTNTPGFGLYQFYQYDSPYDAFVWYTGGFCDNYLSDDIKGFITEGVVAITYDGLYVNGALAGTWYSLTPTDYSEALAIGCRNMVGTPSDFFPGYVQAIGMYKTTKLTAEQVLAVSTAAAAL